MLISDLQHMESASEVEVNGGTGYCTPIVHCEAKDICKPVCYKPSYNVASANAGAQAFGHNTYTSTSTNTKVIQGKYSGSDSSSYAKAY